MALVGWLAYDGQSSRADLAEVRQTAAEEAAEVAMTTADWQRTKFESAIRALDDRQDALDAAAVWIDERRADLDTLEKTDGDDAKWLDQPLPAGIAEWVRSLPREDADAAAVVPDPSVLPDRPAAGSQPEGS
ncbi:hypothetical protein F0A16_20605 [Salinicola corii]|uniref:Uncharacterized protein n=1 Tax=Salinicola corii TaxID=2606937 RepID=A0A640W7C8_9GAMM|nr:hypothetical protein [Salinicola corii]KAA0015491.1 hypothetical protein F0A16_20605 [Salinicola corii]